MRMMFVALVGVLAISAGLANAAQPTQATDYAIFSSSAVDLTSYSTAVGPVYSGGALQLRFGYGIQRPAQNAGDFYARGNYLQESLSQVTGDVYANNDVTLIGSAKISGNVTYGNSFSPSASSTVGGSLIQQAGSIAPVALPPATSFTPGFLDAIHNTNFTLAPGSYGAVQQTGLFQEVHLSSGDYYLNSLSLLNSTTLYLNFTDQQPIRVFVEGDIALDSGFGVVVNGVPVGNGNDGLQTGFAGLTLFETHGDFTIESGFLNYFYGTIFAPFGSVTMNVQDMFGSILAGGPITGNVYIDHRASQVLPVPEPSSVVLLSLGLAAAVPVLMRRRARATSCLERTATIDG